MRKVIVLLVAMVLLASFQSIIAQRSVYTTSGGEMIFQMSELDHNGDVPTNVRWTVFLHLGSYVHMDFTDNIGVYSGLGIRNVGFIVNEVNLDSNLPMKTIRRTYNLGIPLAIKLGSFDNQFYIFGGGEYEWLFHYKEKTWVDGDGSRSGTKVKYTDWFSQRVNALMPSLFVGLQFPGGFNVKFKYYMKNYMNQDYTHSTHGKIYSDFDVKLYYISLSWNIKNKSIKSTFDEGIHLSSR